MKGTANWGREGGMSRLRGETVSFRGRYMVDERDEPRHISVRFGRSRVECWEMIDARIPRQDRELWMSTLFQQEEKRAKGTIYIRPEAGHS